MEDLEYITKDALIMCDKGGAPDFFKPTLNQTVKIHGCLVATQIDFAPLINIPSFKICTITQKPCMPATTPWQNPWPVKVWHQRTLLGRCHSQCVLGGRVEFLTSGQIPLPADAMAEVRELQEQCNKELADAGYGDSVGECGFWEGMTPVWGSGKDMINDIQTGDYGWAALNGVFLVWDVASVVAGVFSFGVGTAAMQGGKITLKQAIRAGVKALSRKALEKIGKQAFKKLTKEALKKNIDDVAKKLLKVCVFACFPAGTPVHTATGIRPIETIRPGDLVWSYNEETGEIGLKEVIQTVQLQADVTLKLRIGNEIIETTAEHPFFTETGWKDAAELELTDQIQRKDNTYEPISLIEYSYLPQKVFNFEVADWHTYFVGIFAWLVHNAKRCLDDAAKAALRILREAYEKEVKNLSTIVDMMRKQDISVEAIARKVHSLRRELGVKYKNLTPSDELELIYKRNIEKYGDELGPTIEYLRGKGKSWEEIIESATRPGGQDIKKIINI